MDQNLRLDYYPFFFEFLWISSCKIDWYFHELKPFLVVYLQNLKDAQIINADGYVVETKNAHTHGDIRGL